MQVMRRIVDDTWLITYPSYVSPAAKNLISRLLERKPARRIGVCRGNALSALLLLLPLLTHLRVVVTLAG